jgi:hypothetical protein
MPDDPIRDVARPPTDGRPYSGGSQPVRETPPEVPGPGRSAIQVVVLVIAALVVLAAVAWIFRWR